MLAECSKGSNVGVGAVARDLIIKIGGDRNSKKSVSHDNLTFSVITDDNLAFLCACDSQSTAQAFPFLGDIKNKWYASFGDQGMHAQILEMNEKFGRTLENRMDFYSNDQIAGLNQQLGEVQNIMAKNIGMQGGVDMVC